MQDSFRLGYALSGGVVAGDGIVVRLPRLIEQLLRLDALLPEIAGAFVGGLRGGHGCLCAHDFDSGGVNRGLRAQEGGLVRRPLEVHELLSLADVVAFLEVELLDLADDVSTDVDFDLGLDLAGCRDDRLNVARRHRLDVDRLPFRPAAPNAGKDDDGNEDERPDDDESFLHLARIACNAGPTSLSRRTTNQRLMMIPADFAFDRRDT